jgi:fructose-specific component phosphotransferase system IIB-like protein
MKKYSSNSTRLIAALLASLFVAILVVPELAASDQYYDLNKEVTLTGTVSSVLYKPAQGMVWGSHLMIETVSGKVDASLGRWGSGSISALSLTQGKQVEITGIMKALNDKQVFLARALKVNGKVYTLRNEHGTPVSPQSRKRAAERGESL